jgi:hypothetical protein
LGRKIKKEIMAHPYNNKSPFNCWKGYERVSGTTPGAKGSCKKSSPANATKGGGTTKVCLPKSKVNNMSADQKKKVVSAKESAGRSGKRERSQRSEIKGARKKGATLKDWFEKENWVNVKTGQECGAPTKMIKSPLNNDYEPGEIRSIEEDFGPAEVKGGTIGALGGVGKSLFKAAEFMISNRNNPRDEARSAQYRQKMKDIGSMRFDTSDTALTSPVDKVAKTTKGKGRNFRSTDEGAGMTEKGVKAYKKENPGSKLQTAVTGDVKPGSKAAKRRKSFCARSKGWTGERGKAARRRWKC